LSARPLFRLKEPRLPRPDGNSGSESYIYYAIDLPSYADDSGATFNFDVTLKYDGESRITVSLSTVDPAGWDSYITYSGKQVSSIDIGPQQFGSPDSKSLTVYLLPETGKTPDPGTISWP